jgi:pyrroloquinoline quinone biosynthesis protein D
MNATLRRGVKLRHDRTRDVTLLLAPDRGLVLSPTTAAILELCDGVRDVDAIASLLSERFAAPAGVIRRDVRTALRRLAESGYVQWSDA